MKTLAHLTLNIFIWRSETGWQAMTAIASGAVLAAWFSIIGVAIYTHSLILLAITGFEFIEQMTPLGWAEGSLSMQCGTLLPPTKASKHLY